MKYANADRRLALAAFAVLALAAIACGALTPDPTATPVPTNTPEPPPTSTPVPAPTAFTNLEIINQASYDLCGVYIQPDTDGGEDFGPNRIAEGDVVAAGSSYTITDIPQGVFRVRVNNCDGFMVNALYGAELNIEEMTWTIDEASLQVINDSSHEICEVNISPNSAPTWGPNGLNEGQVLAPGQDTTFFIAAGSWDLRAVPCDSSVTETTSIGADIEGDLTWTLFDE